ncbi:restriction endonuclease [Haloglomus litoreum]|uniref:restriction endonuclease n=1 Tax=Haloglomus litoreum TaxID=3034026 RepID=UPI0023E8B930|nr:restriction endonuclease [Haloglomus sp. DT116]
MEESSAEIDAYLDEIDAYEFEALVAKIWEKDDWTTSITSDSNDRGIDVVAQRETPTSQKVLIQAKAWSEDNKVGSEEVRKYATLYQQEEDVDSVVIVTTGWFTSQAQELASDLEVRLVNRDDLHRLLSELDGFNVDSMDTPSTQDTLPDWLSVDIREHTEVYQQLGTTRNADKAIDFVNKMAEKENISASVGPGIPEAEGHRECTNCRRNEVYGFELLNDEGWTQIRKCFDCRREWLRAKNEGVDWMVRQPSPFDENRYSMGSDGNIVAPIQNSTLTKCPICGETDCIWLSDSAENYDYIAKCETCSSVWERNSKLLRKDRWECIESGVEAVEIGTVIVESEFRDR